MDKQKTIQLEAELESIMCNGGCGETVDNCNCNAISSAVQQFSRSFTQFASRNLNQQTVRDFDDVHNQKDHLDE